jgi:hypothetical protein
MQATQIKGEIDRSNWKEFLDDFSKRNELRPARVEVLGMDIGAQEEGVHLPLVGISFEPKGAAKGSVEIFLGGETAKDERHLEHLVLNVTHIVPIAGIEQVEDGLAIEDNEGRRTLVLFETLPELPVST